MLAFHFLFQSYTRTPEDRPAWDFFGSCCRQHAAANNRIVLPCSNLGHNWPFGAALSFMLMIVTLLFTVIANVVVVRRYAH